MKDIFFAICVVSFVPSILFLIYAILTPLSQKYTDAKWQFFTLKGIMLLFIIPVYGLIHELACYMGDFFHIPLLSVFSRPTSLSGIASVVPSDFTTMQQAKGTHLDLWTMISILWVIGIVVISIYQVYAYRQFIKKLKSMTPATDIEHTILEQKHKLGVTENVGVFYNLHTVTPMLIGMIKPKIILPCMDCEPLPIQYVLIHELTHLKRKDLWWKLALQIISTIHWFNPLLYPFHMAFETQLEYACDELVAQTLLLRCVI